MFQTRADVSVARNSFPPTVGNEFPPVFALPRTARTNPTHKIRSRQTSATNFRRFLRFPNPRGRIYRKKFLPANRRQRISASFCASPNCADASAAQNSFPQTVGNVSEVSDGILSVAVGVSETSDGVPSVTVGAAEASEGVLSDVVGAPETSNGVLSVAVDVSEVSDGVLSGASNASEVSDGVLSVAVGKD